MGVHVLAMLVDLWQVSRKWVPTSNGRLHLSSRSRRCACCSCASWAPNALACPVVPAIISSRARCVAGVRSDRLLFCALTSASAAPSLRMLRSGVAAPLTKQALRTRPLPASDVALSAAHEMLAAPMGAASVTRGPRRQGQQARQVHACCAINRIACHLPIQTHRAPAHTAACDTDILALGKHRHMAHLHHCRGSLRLDPLHQHSRGRAG